MATVTGIGCGLLGLVRVEGDDHAHDGSSAEFTHTNKVASNGFHSRPHIS